jgi:hypothetical protein
MVAISLTSLASSFGLAAAALAGFAEAELILLIRCAAFVSQGAFCGRIRYGRSGKKQQSGQALDLSKTPAIDFLTTF